MLLLKFVFQLKSAACYSLNDIHLTTNWTILKRTSNTCFLSNINSFWTSFFIKQDFFYFSQSETRIIHVAIFSNGSGPNETILYRTSNRCFLSNISSFGQAVSEKTTFSISANQKQESPIAAMFVDGTGRNEQSI